MEQNRADLTLAPDAEDLLLSYSWPGNVRELKNVAQFLAFMVQGQVTLADLPHDLLRDDQGGFSREKEVLAAQCGLGRARSILGALMDAALEDRGAGRKRLEADLAVRGTGCTESEVRAALKALKQAGLVHSGPGRHGSVLTPRGQLFLESLDRGLSS